HTWTTFGPDSCGSSGKQNSRRSARCPTTPTHLRRASRPRGRAVGERGRLMSFLDERAVEGLLLEAFAGLGYERQSDSRIGPDGECAERTSHSDVILMSRLKAAVARLNSDLPESAREEA